MNFRLSADEMLTAIESCKPLARRLARRFKMTNPSVPFRELHEAAMFGLYLAAVKFDPSRGTKFITPAHVYIRGALWDTARAESARGMHVPENHNYFFADVASGFGRREQLHPRARQDPANQFGADFWDFVVSGMNSRDAGIIRRVFRDGLDQVQVAREMKITRARVGQLLKRAVERLRCREDLRAFVERDAA